MRLRLAIAASLLTVGTLAAVTSAPASAAGRAAVPRQAAAGLVHLNGAQETQEADRDGRGTFGYLAFDDTLCYFLTAERIEPAAAAHIHIGARHVAGPIVVGLIPPTDGFSADCITAVASSADPMALLQSELDAIIADPANYYVNVHNSPFPDGAIRGQLH